MMIRHKNIKEMKGQRFGRLLVISYEGSNKFRNALWKCICDCGNETILPRTRLVSGNTMSCGCYNKDMISLPSGEASFNKLFYSYESRAGRKDLDFEISKDEFLSLIHLDCFYCGESPKKYFKWKNLNGGLFYNGLDRLDNNKGYVIDNVVPCCENCNYAKRKMSYNDFKQWIFSLSDHMISKEILHAGY